jgi:16S rRNA (guanine(966)-N(2))-methyltransferase RsmD
MRVIAGIAKGHALQAPKGTKTRPTADRVKEAVFSVLGDLVFKAKVLDCYGGSGALGIEALSRGALLAVFFEREREALNIIKKNLLKTNFSENTKVYGGDVVKILPGLTKAEFDLVFLDPPYNRGEIAKIENALLQEGILKQDAVVVLETEKKQPELFQTENWELKKTSFYGDTAVYYYKKFNAKEKGVKI